MRVAILGSRGFPSTYGGYETLVRHLARHLVSEGHQTTVYCRAREQSRRRWFTEDVRCIASIGRDTQRLSTLTFGLTACVDAVFRRYDAVLLLNIANGFWIPGLRASRIPVAVNTDGLEWERAKWSRVGRAVFRAGAAITARSANQLICDSQAIGDVWRERFGRESIFIPYGAPVITDRSRHMMDRVGIQSPSYLLIVARLAPENNVDLTLDALDLLGEAAPHAIVVGTASAESPTEAKLRRLEATGRVKWLGHVDDQLLLTQLWANCSVYIHGHSVGGTNPALLQALGAGAPTLALDTPFNREVLTYSDQRFPPNAEVLANAIRRVCDSSDRQDMMRERGTRIIEERYSWRDVCGRYTEVLRGMVER